ncbi:hypothetical protein [Chitinimonas sp. BJB300]|uniref:hypothetical protein n=1 Tax=Chitinimonas sp. BJB300 TaxID=1559339 RepID=UPI00130417E4|nr:hypothetical protein [Chitinimonas sp. BJB300]
MNEKTITVEETNLIEELQETELLEVNGGNRKLPQEIIRFIDDATCGSYNL